MDACITTAYKNSNKLLNTKLKFWFVHKLHSVFGCEFQFVEEIWCHDYLLFNMEHAMTQLSLLM